MEPEFQARKSESQGPIQVPCFTARLSVWLDVEVKQRSSGHLGFWAM